MAEVQLPTVAVHRLNTEYVDNLVPELLIPHYLVHSAMYYVWHDNEISDREYDDLSRRIFLEWDSLEHHHKHLIDRGSLLSGGSYITFPLRVLNCAKDRIRKK